MKRLIAIPAYNEQNSIRKVISEVSSILLQAEYEADIIVFDDLSTDNTAALVNGSGLATVETSSLRGGYWQNIQRAVITAADRGYDQIIFMDADGQHDPSNLPAIISNLALGSNIVIVSRFGSASQYHMEFSKRIGRLFYRILLRFLVGYTCQDPTSGNIGMDRNTLLKLAPIARPELFMDTTFIAWALASGLSVNEVQGLFHEAEHSTIYPNIFSAFSTFLNTICTTIAVYMKTRRNSGGLYSSPIAKDSAAVNILNQASSSRLETAVVRQQEPTIVSASHTPTTTPGTERG